MDYVPQVRVVHVKAATTSTMVMLRYLKEAISCAQRGWKYQTLWAIEKAFENAPKKHEWRAARLLAVLSKLYFVKFGVVLD